MSISNARISVVKNRNGEHKKFYGEFQYGDRNPITLPCGALRLVYNGQVTETELSLPVTFQNKHGKLDTSRRMIHMSGASKWRSNREWFTSTKKSVHSPNQNHRCGDGVKHLSIPLEVRGKIPQSFGVVESVALVNDWGDVIGSIIKQGGNQSKYCATEFLKPGRTLPTYDAEFDDIIFSDLHFAIEKCVDFFETEELLDSEWNIKQLTMSIQDNDLSRVEINNVKIIEGSISEFDTLMQEFDPKVVYLRGLPRIVVQDAYNAKVAKHQRYEAIFNGKSSDDATSVDNRIHMLVKLRKMEVELHQYQSALVMPTIMGGAVSMMASSNNLVNKANVTLDRLMETADSIDSVANHINAVASPENAAVVTDILHSFHTPVVQVRKGTQYLTDLLDVIKSKLEILFSSCSELFVVLFNGIKEWVSCIHLPTVDAIGQFLEKNKFILIPAVTSAILQLVIGLRRPAVMAGPSQDTTLFPLGLVLSNALCAHYNKPLESSFLTKTLSSAKSFNSFKGISSALEAMVPTIMDYVPQVLCDFVQYYFPKVYQYYVLRYVDPEFNINVENLIKLAVLQNSDSHSVSEFYRSYEKLYAVADKYASFAVFDSPLITTIEDTYEHYMQNGLMPGNRVQPVVVWLCGTPGVGKSNLAQELAMSFKDRSLAYYSDVYPWNTKIEFVDGYSNHSVVILNDYLQFTDAHEENVLIDMYDTIDYPLNTSSVDNPKSGIKGEVKFTSKLVIITSNTSILHNSATMRDVSAFNRRRDFVVDMSFKQGRVMDATPNYSWASVARLNPLTGQALGERIDAKKAIDELKADIFHLLFARRTNMLRKAKNKPQEVVEPQACDVEHVRAMREKSLPTVMAGDEEFEDVDEFPRGPLLQKVFAKRMAVSVIDRVLGSKTGDFLRKIYVPIAATTIGVGLFYLLKTWFKTKSSIMAVPSGDEITRKYHPRRVVPKPKPRTMGGDFNDHAGAIDKVGRNMYRVTSQSLKFADLRSVNGIVLSHCHMLLPKHLIYRGVEMLTAEDSLYIMRKGFSVVIPFDLSRVTMGEFDWIVYDLTTVIQPAKNVIKLFSEKDFAFLKSMTGFALTLDRKGEEIVRHIFSVQTELKKDYYDFVPGSQTKKYQGSTMLSYKSQLTHGDCGAPIFIIERGALKIFGIHVGGVAGSYQYAQHIYNLNVDPFDLEEIQLLEGVPLIQGMTYLGDLPKNMVPYLNTQTAIKPSELHGTLQSPLTQPSILSPGDPRNVEHISPLIKGVEKYTRERRPMTINSRESVKAMVRECLKPLHNVAHPILTLDEAINGTEFLEKIDVHTSSGFPYTVSGLKKSDFVKFNEATLRYDPTPLLIQELEKWMQCFGDNTYPSMVWTNCVKDERRKHKKIESVSSRIFTISNLLYTLVGRAYFGSFIGQYMFQRHEVMSGVGMNAFVEFQPLALRLSKHKSVNDGDFSGWDGDFSQDLFYIWREVVEDFMSEQDNFSASFSKYKPNPLFIRRFIYDEEQFSKMIVLNQVYCKNWGGPSGSFWTTIRNDIGHKALMFFCWLSVCPGDTQLENFRKNVELATFGDDGVFSVSDLYRDKFNSSTISQILEGLNFIYTSGDKGQQVLFNKSLEEVTFLKYNFKKQESGLMGPALDKTVIQEMISWTRSDGGDSHYDLQMTVDSCMKYCFYHGREYYAEIRNKILARNKGYIIEPYHVVERKFLN